MSEQVELIRNDEAGRYELTVDGRRVSLADFYERDGVVVIPHTETLPAYGGRGLAGRLVRFALDDIAAQGKRVDPACPFVAVYIQRNPEYRPLLVG
ncbi:N-acetyltransferase [Jatrophihabitans telluris]|uniref:N-acetyltransferase n=1 Tax=Jatrophihabitans telluris TaxID=2038343 RepID=A0ABY4QWX4_9ACTN|nr:GNAT family N-acetyltransferase [Jatrophihabitans telluris]UQX88040.1 N-acetyltransferase [Jatrophihabitans telluris]